MTTNLNSFMISQLKQNICVKEEVSRFNPITHVRNFAFALLDFPVLAFLPFVVELLSEVFGTAALMVEVNAIAEKDSARNANSDRGSGKTAQPVHFMAKSEKSGKTAKFE